MKCIQIENEVKTINTMRHERGRRQRQGLGPPGTGGPAAAAVPFHLSMVLSGKSSYRYLLTKAAKGMPDNVQGEQKN